MLPQALRTKVIEVTLSDSDTSSREDKFFLQRSDIVYSCPNLSALPEASGIEVAVAGRSNVGKSSLINALLGRRNLAYTSRTPGRTQLLNFIEVGEGDLYLVDMPGYGYAKAARSSRVNWKKMVFGYARGRANLRRTLLLIDSRLGLKDLDREAITIFNEAATGFQVILTKADKVSSAELEQLHSQLVKELVKWPAGYPVIIPTSIRRPDTIRALRRSVFAVLNQ